MPFRQTVIRGRIAGPLATALLASVALAVPAGSAVSAADESVSVAPWLAARLQRALDRDRLALGIPGASVAVVFADGSAWTGVSGLADVRRGIPVTPQTPFALASLSKPLVAGVVMGLVEERRLHLGDSVARLLREVRLGGRALDPRITVRQLLDHTSGLRDHLTTSAMNRALWADPAAPWTAEQALAYVRPATSEPGRRFVYANTNYLLLGLLVERIEGRPVAAVLRSRWIEPLGLETASFQGVEPPTSTPAVAYRFATADLAATPVEVADGTDVRPFTAVTTASGAAGSVMAGALDSARWFDALVTADVLRPTTVARMIADADRTTASDPGRPYGLGLEVTAIDGRVCLGHGGRFIGQRSVVRHFPDAGITIVVLTNQSRADPAVILRSVLAIVLPSHAADALRAA